MRELEPIAVYLAALQAELERDGAPAARLVDEVAQHLVESAAHIAAGEACDDVEAARRAIERFGSPAMVAASVRRQRVGSARSLTAATARLSSLAVAALAALLCCRALVDVTGGGRAGDALALALLTLDLLVFSRLVFRRARSPVAQRPLWRGIVALHAIFALSMLWSLFAGAALHVISTEHVLRYTVLNGHPVESALFCLLAVQSAAALRLARSREDSTALA